MTVHHYLTGLSPEEQVRFALRYPFDQVDTSFIFAGGEALPLVSFDSGDLPASQIQHADKICDLKECLSGAQYASLFEERFPVIAVGSNCSPEQLARKYAGDTHVVPTLKAEIIQVRGWQGHILLLR